MKFLFALVLLLAIALCFATPQSFSFTGTTPAGQWGGITLGSSGCSLSSVIQNYTYFSFDIDSSNSSYYFVIGSFRADPQTLDVFIYHTLNFSNPCSGLYTQLLNHVESDLQVFDGIYLAEGNYTVLLSSQASLTWGLNFSPSTAVLNITSNSNAYLAPYFDNKIGNSNNCAVNTASTHYESFTWVQQTSGYFDIYGIAINSSQINPFTNQEFSIWLALYNGTIGDISTNACQGNFIAGASSVKSVGGIDYVWLNQGGNYTVVASINSIFGEVGLQITPSTLYSLSNQTLFPYPQDITNCLEDVRSSTDASGETPWFSKVVMPSSPIGIFSTTRAFYQEYYSYFYPQLYLYFGENTGKPPQECYDLVDISYDYDIVGYVNPHSGAFALTVVVGDPNGSGSLLPLSNFFHLFVFSGAEINTPPNLSPIIPTTSSSITTTTSSSSSITTTSRSQTTTTTGVVHQASSSSSTTTLSSSSAKSSTTGVVSSATTGHQNQGVSTTTSGGQASTTGINENRGITSTSGSEHSSTTGIKEITSTGNQSHGTSSTSGSNQTKTTTGGFKSTTTGLRGNHTTGEDDFFSEGSVASISMLALVLLSSLLLLM